jgi:hypothetical protein
MLSETLSDVQPGRNISTASRTVLQSQHPPRRDSRSSSIEQLLPYGLCLFSSHIQHSIFRGHWSPDNDSSKKKKREALRGKRRQSAITRYEKYSRMRYVSALNDVTRFYSPTLRKFIKMESEAENMWLGDVRLRLSTFSLHSIQL